MKSVLSALITFILFVQNVSAQEKQEFDRKNDFKSGSIIISFNKEVIEYQFKSFEDLTNEIDKIIKELDFTSLENENEKEICEVKIEVKIEIDIGITNISVSEIIRTTNCVNETLAVVSKRLKTLLIAVATG